MLLPLCALLGLIACSQPAPDARSGLSPAVLAATTQPLLLVEAENIGASALLNQHARRDGTIDWRTGDNVSITLNRGVVIATRGFGDDLMSADVDQTLAMLQNRPTAQDYPRFLSRLDGEYQTEFESFLCRRTGQDGETLNSYGRLRQTVKITELCRNPGGSFENTYWVGSDGTMWKSRQWVSPDIQYVETELLVR